MNRPALIKTHKSNHQGEEGMMQKIAIILHAEPGTHDAMGRAVHALLYTQELKEAGHEVNSSLTAAGQNGWQSCPKTTTPLPPFSKR